MTGNLRINKDVKVNNIRGGFNNVLIYGYVDKIGSNRGTIGGIVIYNTATLKNKMIGYDVKNVYVENCGLMTELIEHRNTLRVIKELSEAGISGIDGDPRGEREINFLPLSELDPKIIDEIINGKVTHIDAEIKLPMYLPSNYNNNMKNYNKINDSKTKSSDGQTKSNNSASLNIGNDWRMYLLCICLSFLLIVFLFILIFVMIFSFCSYKIIDHNVI